MAGGDRKHGFANHRRILSLSTITLLLGAALGLFFASNALAVPPEVIFDAPSPADGALINTRTPGFAFHSDPAATRWECSSDGGATFGTCNIGNSGFTFSSLNDGPYTFVARAYDLDDNVIADGTRTFTVDATPPSVTITGPTGPTNADPVEFSFSSDDPAATFRCALNGTALSDCTSPQSFSAVPPGDHTFTVEAKDVAGNTNSQQQAFLVDVSPPETTIDSGPSDGSSTATPSFTFSASEPATFSCQLDGQVFLNCQSPFTTPGLADGPHDLQVTATDVAGNADPTPAQRFFTVHVPSVTTSTGPPTTSSNPTKFVGSFVLISGKRAELSRTRKVAVRLNCSGNRNCAGSVILTSAKRVRIDRRHKRRGRIIRLGSAKFAIPAGKTATVTITISRGKARIVRRLHRLDARVTVNDKDGAGRARSSTRTIRLRAR
jgi:hypothetical protein